jgi:hypothetical protein
MHNLCDLRFHQLALLTVSRAGCTKNSLQEIIEFENTCTLIPQPLQTQDKEQHQQQQQQQQQRAVPGSTVLGSAIVVFRHSSP